MTIIPDVMCTSLGDIFLAYLIVMSFGLAAACHDFVCENN